HLCLTAFPTRRSSALPCRRIAREAIGLLRAIRLRALLRAGVRSSASARPSSDQARRKRRCSAANRARAAFEAHQAPRPSAHKPRARARSGASHFHESLRLRADRPHEGGGASTRSPCAQSPFRAHCELPDPAEVSRRVREGARVSRALSRRPRWAFFLAKGSLRSLD